MFPGLPETAGKKGMNNMKETILENLARVIGALNLVSVHGKENLANLSGSIAVLERILEELRRAEITESAEQKPDTE